MITVFRPFSEEVQAIVAIKDPLVYPVTSPSKKNEHTTSPSSNTNGNSLIVTIGKGYRSLIGRYVNMGDRRVSIKGQSCVSKSVEDLDYEDFSGDYNSSTMYALLWKPDHWLSE